MSMRKDAQPGVGTPACRREAIDVHQQLPRPIVEVLTQGSCPCDIDIKQSAGDHPDFLVDAAIPKGSTDYRGNVTVDNAIEIAENADRSVGWRGDGGEIGDIGP